MLSILSSAKIRNVSFFENCKSSNFDRSHKMLTYSARWSSVDIIKPLKLISLQFFNFWPKYFIIRPIQLFQRFLNNFAIDLLPGTKAVACLLHLKVYQVLVQNLSQCSKRFLKNEKEFSPL